eukprot:gene34342-biopygen26299
MRWLRRPPPRFDHGVSLRDATPAQQIWLNEEIKRALGSGAWKRASKREHVSRVLLVKKSGTNKWRLIVDMRWLNSFCVKSKGQLFQFSALPFGWSDAPRIFVKFMKVMVEALRSPGAAEDRRELLKPKNRRVATPRYEVRRRAGEEAFVQRERVRRALARLGLTRNEKKGQWEPGQLIEHLGLEVDLREGLFRVTEARVAKIHVQAKSIICDASRDRRWLSARRLASFNGLCQSVYLAVPAARLYLRELYFVLTTKRSWGAKVKLSRQALHDLEWWLRLPVMSRWNGRKIWRSPTRAKLHTDSSLRAWGGVLNLDKEARGFWPDELRHLHITHLELEAVFKTAQSFMPELEGKVVRLYCDNQAVVAMLSHFMSRNPELMRRMRKLWLLLDLNDIELQARYIRSEANERADRLSRCKDIDDWQLNRRWFEWADSAWGPHTVDRFASEISAQLPRYFAGWHDPRCEGVDSLAYDWRGEINWVNPPWALLDEEGPLRPEQARRFAAAGDVKVGRSHVPHPPEAVNDSSCTDLRQPTSAAVEPVPVGTRLQIYWELDDAWYPVALVLYDEDSFANIVYNDGDKEVVDLANEQFKIIGDVETPIELGTSEHSELVVQMQKAALQPTTKGKYDPKVRKFVLFCQQQGREWLPATTATVLLYLSFLLKSKTIKSSSLQPYLSAINNYHEDLHYEAPAKGRSVTRAVKGMAVLQADQQVISAEAHQLDRGRTVGKGRRHHQVKRRLQIPWKGVTGLREALENWQVHRDLAWKSSTSSRTPTDNVAGSYWRLPGERGAFEGASLANEWIQLALGLLGCIPPEGGHFTAHSTRKGAATTARAVGTMLERVCFFGGWAQNSSVVHRYIDPTAVPDEYMKHFFGWMAP